MSSIALTTVATRGALSEGWSSGVPRALALGVAPLVLLAAVAPALRVEPYVSVMITFATAAAAVVIGTTASPDTALRAPRTALAVFVLGVACVGLSLALARLGPARIATDVVSGLAASTGVLACGSAVGALVGGRIAHPGHLTAVALASSAADIWSVHSPRGLTHSIVVTPDHALQRLLTISAAVPPSRWPAPAVGFGDVLFAALYLAATTRHDLPRWRTVLAVALGLLAAGASTIALDRPLPALPFIGLAVVVLQPAARRIERRDRFPTVIAGCLVVLAFVLVRR